MRFKELREYYAMLRRRQKLWYSVPYIVGAFGALFSIMGVTGLFTIQLFGSLLTGMIARATIDLVTWILIILAAVLLPIEHTERYMASPIIMLGITLASLVLFGTVSIPAFTATCYYIAAAVFMKPIAEQILFMKDLPDFPFLERVELERMEYERTLLYSEKANQTLAKDKMPKKPHEEYDGSQQKELLDTLPKRHLEDFHIKHGEFDEPEAEYTDDLANADPNAYREDVDFEEPDKGFNEIKRSYSEDDLEHHEIEETNADPSFRP